jgi:maleylacetate reductase
MVPAFVYSAPTQRVVFGAGSLGSLTEEIERIGLHRVLVITTPGGGARFGDRVLALLGTRTAGLHAEAVIHVPRPVAEAGLDAARERSADGVVAVGGGSAIGLAKIIARGTGLPIVAVPTTYSGSEVTPIWGTSEGERKITGRDARVIPRTVIYDPELTLELSPAVTAASAMNAIAHCVEGLWVAERTPASVAFATEAMRRFGQFLQRSVANGYDRAAREECLAAAWLAGLVLVEGTGLQHKLAHVLGGFGLPHAEVHAIILPHVTSFNLPSAPQARDRLADALGSNTPVEKLEQILRSLPIPQRLRDVGFEIENIPNAAEQVAALRIKEPRLVLDVDVRAVLAKAF